MVDKELIHAWLTSVASDDYVAANEQFPKVVQSSLNSLINNRKPGVIEQLNTQAEAHALQVVELTKPPSSEGSKT